MSKLPQPFSNPTTYTGHSGVDYGEPSGKIIKASGNGIITFVGWWNDRAGWSTIVDYDNAPAVLYCHQLNMPGVKKGNRTFEGSQIGVVGSSGHSTGPHLHMEIMSGNGAHTYDGVWLYFDKNRVVGDGSSAGDKSDESEEDGVYIANVAGSFYLVQNVKGQPTGHLLGASSGARESGLPVINYPDKWAKEQLLMTTVLK